jgi:hypothetical protein
MASRNTPRSGPGGVAPGVRFSAFRALLVAGLLGAPGGAASASEAAERPAPFETRNLDPFILVYGLPPPGAVELVPPGQVRVRAGLDVANSFHLGEVAEESISLDGETWRLSLSARYGVSDRLEAGLELPILFLGGGVLDPVIEGWHAFWGMSDHGRLDAPRGRLDYSYRAGGQELVAVRSPQAGIGDVRLFGGVTLFKPEDGCREVALRGSLELPTGDAARLLGSGSVDAALSVDVVERSLWSRGIVVFGRLGVLASSDGDVLPENQRHLVPFGGLGLSWRAGDRIDLKVQVDAHGSFYRSELSELGSGGIQLTFGATFLLGRTTTLDVAASENVRIDTVPDFGIHLAVSRRW